MHRYPPAATDANGTDLPFPSFNIRLNPNTCFTWRTLSFDAIVRERKNNGFFQVSQVFTDIGRKLFKIKYRISYDLLRSVKSNVSSPIGAVKTYLFTVSFLFVD